MRIDSLPFYVRMFRLDVFEIKMSAILFLIVCSFFSFCDFPVIHQMADQFSSPIYFVRTFFCLFSLCPLFFFLTPPKKKLP